MRAWAVLAISIALVAGMAACSSPQRGPYEPAKEAERSTARAEALNREAADQLGVDDAAAERLLREALTADLFFGPAHNNLGVSQLGVSEPPVVRPSGATPS